MKIITLWCLLCTITLSAQNYTISGFLKDKSIQLLPGVTNSGEGFSGFNVRGDDVDQNLILLDEAIIYTTSHLKGFFSVFNEKNNCSKKMLS